MTRRDKIQALLIHHLMSEGEIALTLPDGMTLEVGVTNDGKHGTERLEDYCWVQATQDERAAFMDSYSLHLTYPQETAVYGCDDGLDVF